MSSIADALAGLVQTVVCEQLAVGEAYAQALAAIMGPIATTAYNAAPLVKTAHSLYCDPPDPNNNGKGNGLPPGSGNCRKRYNIQWASTLGDGSSNSGTRYGYWGPIGSIIPVDYNGVPGSFGSNCNGAQIWAYGDDETTPTASPILMPLTGGSGPSGCDDVNILSISTSDESPDNCPAETVPPPQRLPDSGLTIPRVPFTVGGNNYTCDVTLFQPVLTPGFVLIAPFFLNTSIAFQIGNLQIAGNLSIPGGQVNFNFSPTGLPPSPGNNGGGGGGGTLPQLPVGNPPPPPSSSKPDPENPGVTKKTVIIGVQVNVSSITGSSKATKIPQGNNPDIYAPALGFVNFYYRGSDGNPLGWSSDIAVKNTYTFIPCPNPTGAADVAGTPNPGVTWTLTPITGTITVNR